MPVAASCHFHKFVVSISTGFSREDDSLGAEPLATGWLAIIGLTRMKTPLWLITDNWRILAWLIIQWLSPSKLGHDYYWLSINLSLRNEWFFIDFQIIYSLTFDWFNVKFSMLFYWLVFQCFFIDWFFNVVSNDYKIQKLNFTIIVFFLYQFWTPVGGFPYPCSPFLFYLLTYYNIIC
jgi:hypothetical protein